jgi:predicted RNA-binding protein with PUA-like domain
MRHYDRMATAKRYWLLKSEPEAYSIDTLKRDKKTPWSGVRNYQARNFMRDEMQIGDECFFYHTGDEKAVVGLAKVVSRPHADETAFDTKGYYFDSKSTREQPIWMCVDVAFVKKFTHPISLAEIKTDPKLEGMVLRRASRLSIQPVSEEQFNYIKKLAAEI